MKKWSLIPALIVCTLAAVAQPVPAEEENIPFLVTFGREAYSDWGDDDNCQIFFFSVPENHTTPIFIRVFDPDVGGKHDELRTDWNSAVKYSVIGGKGSFSKIDRENKDPIGNFKNGNMLATKTFGATASYDNKWYTFGPFNPTEGSLIPELGGYIFKMVAEGVKGDDGNLYRYYLSTSPSENKAIEGGNAFTYEYSFRLHTDAKKVSHIYPYVDQHTISVKQHNYDFDGDAYIRVVSVAKPGIKVATSKDGDWVSSTHAVVEAEKGTSLDFQIHKEGTQNDNNVCFYVTNQYGKFMPFYTIPIGGVPKYSFCIKSERR